jgi:hypothetical protein
MQAAQKFYRPVLHNYLIIVTFAAEALSDICVFQGTMAPVDLRNSGVEG